MIFTQPLRSTYSSRLQVARGEIFCRPTQHCSPRCCSWVQELRGDMSLRLRHSAKSKCMSCLQSTEGEISSNLARFTNSKCFNIVHEASGEISTIFWKPLFRVILPPGLLRTLLRTTCSTGVHVARGCMVCKLKHPRSSRRRSPVHGAKREKSSMLWHAVLMRYWRLAHPARGDISLTVHLENTLCQAHPILRHLSPESLFKPVKSTGTFRFGSYNSAKCGKAASGEWFKHSIELSS
jgi:hypothetical protein